MAKTNNPGCATNDCCKCVPITERVDEFDSTLWKCFKGLPNGYGLFGDGGTTAFPNPSAGWTVAGGQLLYSRPAAVVNEDVLSVEAVRLAVPYSMEFILEVAELNVVSGDQAALMIQMNDGGIGGGTGGTISSVLRAGPLGSVASVLMSMAGTSSGIQGYDNPLPTSITSPFTLWYRIQVDTDGMTQWLWIDGVAPTGYAWGTKLTATPPALTGTRKRYWSLAVRTASAARPNWAKFNRLEVREWDHTMITLPHP